MKTPEPDCYETLGVNRDATVLDIEAAWQKKQREYDPEKLQGFGEKLRMLAEAETEWINVAYETLKDPEQRKEYDRRLAGHAARPTKPTQAIQLERFMSKQAEIANDRAIRYWEQDRFDEAITQWNEALRNNPNIAEIHHNLGRAYAHQGQIEEAVQSLTSALSIDPTLVEAYNKLGCVYYEQGNLEVAFASWRQALRIDPNFKEARHNLRLIQNVTQFDVDSEIPAYQHVAEEDSKQSSRYADTSTWTNRIRRRFAPVLGKLQKSKDESSQ
jgi:tetratricopeptide (TPR) repeat protein